MCLLGTLFSDPYYFFASPNFHRFSVINRVPSLLSISSSINRHIHHTMKNHHHLCSVSSSVLFRLVATLCFLVLSAVSDDVAVMNALNKTINLSGTLNWSGLDVCQWKNVQCSSGSSPVQVTSIQLANLNLHGTLPKEIVELSQLQHFDVRQNSLSGAVPYMPKSLRELFVSNNNFTSFPNDFFNGMANLETVSIGYNSFPSWNIPPSLKNCVALISFSAIKANFVGPIPNFVSKDNFPGMNSLTLSFNSLEGELPSSFAGSPIVTLWLNGNKFNGTLEVLQNMNSLGQIWVHGNSFTGPIPEFTSNDQLYDVSLRDNKLTGIVPQSLIDLISLQVVNLTNNLLQGPFPKFKDGVRVDNQGVNRYCTKVAGEKCSPVVETLLFVAKPLGYPAKLAESWSDNNPCSSSNRWLGVVCDVQGKIVVINFQNMGFSGSISPAFANLTDLTMLILSGNNLTGTIPLELTNLPALKEVDVSNNNLYGKIPKFGANVVVKTDGNPSIGKDGPLVAPGPGSGGGGSGGRKGNVGAMAGVVVGVVVLLGAGGLVFVMYGRKKKRSGGGKAQNSNAIVLHPRHSGDGDAVKISVVDSTTGVGHGHDGMGSYSPAASSDVQHVEAGNMVISIQVLRQVTDNFSEENILGKGGFGTVYKGELHDGTKIAVKRMESGIVGQGEKGLTEFKSEIAVLTKVRHRHLVALLGHCLDGNEGLLVYEYMPQGPLSKHLFDWKVEGLKPLEWKRRLVIALDVARGVEYLHGLAQHIFIHRDLKPSNILLGNDMRAKVSDFGLVRLAPEGQTSFETRLAGTFGYLAPEYAVTGRVTTKVDIYSYGVILMEMITGRKAIDSSQPEENIHLVTWFRRMLLNKDSIRKFIDPAIDVNDDEEALASFTTVAELASHCCAREPYQRPDMSHVVNVLAPLVEIWKPAEPNVDDIYGIDLDMSLPQALSKWQAFEGRSTLDLSSSSMLTSGENTQSSIPTRPSGFADSFTSSDGR